MTGASTTIADKLLSAKIITQEKYHETLAHFKHRGGFIEESLIQTEAIDEETLLKHISQMYRTRYVLTEKLRHADIPQNVLEMVSGKLAKKYTVFPILFNTQNGELSIVSSDLSNVNIEQEVSHSCTARRVRCFAARPAAIQAAISKFYRGDIHAFANLDGRGSENFQSMLDVYERNLLDEESMAVSLADAQGRKDRMISLDEMERGAARAEVKTTTGDGDNLTAMLEMMRVMVSLVESTRGDLAGHSVQTAYFAEQVCQRIGLTEREGLAVTLAALIHDLGKGSPYHLTPFNVAEWDGHRTAAEKRFENPGRLFQSINLPDSTLTALRHMYERNDGQGLPEGMRGKDIPLSARILGMADTYSDLTSNPRNPYRRTLGTEEAMQCLEKAKNKIFDPNLVDLFGMVVAGDDIKRKLLTGAQTVLVVDSDPEQNAILDLQLTSRGFRVRTARTGDLALKIISEKLPNVIISEVDMEPFNGFELKKRLNEHAQAKTVPFIYFTSRAASADVETGFNLGAQDYLVKPSTIDVVAAKIHKILGEKPGQTGEGVSGSLKEMSLPDLVQILSHGRKNGQLKLTMGKHRGEIHFVKGDIYNAMFDQVRGEEAFFQMLRFKEGTFSLNPNFKIESRAIEMTAEMLLLEGMRRFDEGNR